MDRENHPTGVMGSEGVHILNRFVKNYEPPVNPVAEGIQKVLYLDPSPEPDCTEDRINLVLSTLDTTISQI